MNTTSKSEGPEIAVSEPSEPAHQMNAKQGDSIMTQTTDVPLPIGGDPDMWIGDQREVYAQVGYVPLGADLLSCPTVTVVAEQRRDGSLGCIDVMLDVAMGRSDAALGVSQARELAALLVAGADLADQWISGETL